MTKYFVDKDGSYIGGFDGGSVVFPENGVEVPFAPANALDKWDGEKYIPYIVPIDSKDVLLKQAEEALQSANSVAGLKNIIKDLITAIK